MISGASSRITVTRLTVNTITAAIDSGTRHARMKDVLTRCGRDATARRAAAGTFTLAPSEGAQTQNPVASLRTVGGIDALVALQGVEDATERRRRAVAKGRNALDTLDDLKLALLAGDRGPTTLNRLRAAAADLKDSSGETALDSVLAEIELRVAVELAKMTTP